jgi:hypothetical protein
MAGRHSRLLQKLLTAEHAELAEKPYELCGLCGLCGERLFD